MTSPEAKALSERMVDAVGNKRRPFCEQARKWATEVRTLEGVAARNCAMVDEYAARIRSLEQRIAELEKGVQAMVPEEGFKVGDTVEWSSQAQGHHRTKRGVIAAIVPPQQRPSREAFLHLHKNAGCGWGRDHESYVVLVGRKPYWPIAKNLRKVEQAIANASRGIE